MKTLLTSLIICTAAVSAAWANTAPTPVIVSAAMRPGTTLMDVVFRVNDPDDATVKVRALAFVDGVRSFANVLRPVTIVEGTAAKIGDAIASNTNHTLTWDVAADWNIALGQVKFEILARDGRGLLAFDWITIPAAGGNPALTISKDAPSDASVLDALFWQYGDGDTGLTLGNGVLRSNANNGNFAGIILANGVGLQPYSAPYFFKTMNLDPAMASEVYYAGVTARAGLLATTKWHAVNRPYSGVEPVFGWGDNTQGATMIPGGLTGVKAIAGGYYHSLALKNDGTVISWPADTIPPGLNGIIAIAAGEHNLALKSDGTVVGWADGGGYGAIATPPGLTDVTAIAAAQHSLALRSNGTVVAWGKNVDNQTTVPSGLSNVVAIAAGLRHSLALTNDGAVIAWGSNTDEQATVPPGLTGVTAIAAGFLHSLALKSDGTVVAWGNNVVGQTSIPAGLTGVTAIAAGGHHNLALKSDGTVVGWGLDYYGAASIPAELTGVTAIAAGQNHSLALKPKAH